MGVDVERLLEDGDGLVELLHLLVADALEIVGVGVAGSSLTACWKLARAASSSLSACWARPRLYQACALGGRERWPACRTFLASSSLLQRQQRNALVDGGLGQGGVLLEGGGKAVRGAVSELLAHLRHAAVVEAHGLGVVGGSGGGRGRDQQEAERRQR